MEQLMTDSSFLTFNKTRFHQNAEMQAWGEKYCGEGKWINEPYPKEWTGLPNWTIHSMFGNTTFAFKNKKHYNWFLLKWEGDFNE
jgi:hypothetical protein